MALERMSRATLVAKLPKAPVALSRVSGGFGKDYEHGGRGVQLCMVLNFD